MSVSFQTSQEAYIPYPASYGIPLVAVNCFSACLSIAGSSCIILMARRDFFRQTLQRILFCISLSDIGLSITLLLMPFVVPQELDLNYAAFGNQQTCSAAVFFMGTFVLANAHDGTIGAHSSALVCGPDLKSHHSLLVKVISYFYAGVMVLANLASFVALFLLYWTVRKKMKQSSRFRFKARRGSAGSVATPKNQERQGGDDQDQTQDPSITELQLESSSNHTWIARISNASRSSWLAGPSRLSGSSRTSQRERDPFQQRILQVRTQSICYSLIYFNSLIFWFVLQGSFAGFMTPDELQQKKTSPGLYTLHMLAAFFIPLAGACNFLVYTRPKVQRWKKIEPDRTRFWILRELIKGTEIPTSSSAARRRRQPQEAKKKKKKQSEEAESPTTTCTSTNVGSCCYSANHDGSAAVTTSIMVDDGARLQTTRQETTQSASVHQVDTSLAQGATTTSPN